AASLSGGNGDDSLVGGSGADTLVGAAGADTLIGGAGADRLDAGDGKDFVDGKAGSDTALLGSGDDIFQWDPGDGSDTVEGQGGNDTMLFYGSNIAEKMDLSANGSRLRMTRDVASIVMDVNGVENVNINVFGGADSIVVHDLQAT